MTVAARALAAGDTLARRSSYLLEAWWVDLFNDALCEPKVARGDDLNPVFAYLIMQDVVDLHAFFSSVTGGAESTPVLHGGLTIESLGAVGIRADETYDVVVSVESIDEKQGRTLGRFRLVTILALVRGTSTPSDFHVRSRILFGGVA